MAKTFSVAEYIKQCGDNAASMLLMVAEKKELTSEQRGDLILAIMYYYRDNYLVSSLKMLNLTATDTGMPLEAVVELVAHDGRAAATKSGRNLVNLMNGLMPEVKIGYAGEAELG